MVDFARPRIVISRCLGFDTCRWNGVTMANEMVDMIKGHVDAVTPCPETDIGLGIPREPIRLVEHHGEIRLQQNATERDITDEMRSHITALLAGLPPVDGFILKAKSPTCGMHGIKVYPRLGKVGALRSNGRGFFGGVVVERYPTLPLDDEGQLKNAERRELFLTRIFTLAAFRAVRVAGTAKALVDFHTEYKLLLAASAPGKRQILGGIVANHGRRPLTEVVDDYEAELRVAMATPPRAASHVAVMQKMFGFVSKEMAEAERRHVLDTFERYVQHRVPLTVPRTLLRALVERYEQPYLERSRYFSPYPDELREITDGGETRSY